MINMMYLVLTAMLALNVSKEILKSFHLMEVSFNQAQENLDVRIGGQMDAFSKQVKNDVTLAPYYKRAQEAQRITSGFIRYIEDIKSELTTMTGGRQDLEDGTPAQAYETELVGNDNLEVHANYFLVDNAKGTKAKGWRGLELEKRVNNTRNELLNLLKTNIKENVKIAPDKLESVRNSCQLEAELDEQDQRRFNTWSEKYVENSPLAAVVTLLSKMQTDAKSTEAAVIDVLMQGIVPELPPVTGLVPLIKPLNGSVIMNGAAYEAEIILAAQTRGSESDVYQLNDGQGKIEKRDGKWIYTSTVNQSGAHNFNGVVTVKSPSGDKNYPFDGGFQVFSGGATVSATKMNVLYVGIDNDISVGVPGVNPSDVQVSMTGGTIRKQNGRYIARCPQRGDAVITVSARLSDGTTRTVAQETYRVKKIRTPYVLLSGLKNGDRVPKQRLRTVTSVTATVGPDFPIEGLRYQVTRFQLITMPKKGDPVTLNISGHRLTNGMQGALRELDRGDRLMITGVRASGPNGNLQLEPIMIEII